MEKCPSHTTQHLICTVRIKSRRSTAPLCSPQSLCLTCCSNYPEYSWKVFPQVVIVILVDRPAVSRSSSNSWTQLWNVCQLSWRKCRKDALMIFKCNVFRLQNRGCYDTCTAKPWNVWVGENQLMHENVKRMLCSNFLMGMWYQNRNCRVWRRSSRETKDYGSSQL